MKNLRQLLFESCNVMATYSNKCSQSPVTQDSPISHSLNAPCCGWYHGAWQYLRILNCVSSPQWHENFYKQSFNSVFDKKKNVRILICGTADYSLLYLLVSVLNETDINAKIDILDICVTPLKICEWFAKNCNNRELDSNYQVIDEFDEYNRKFRLNDKIIIETFKNDIKSFYPEKGELIYDIICSDAFLTRFSADIKIVLDRWEKLLLKDGRIITTVRLYENADNIQKQSLAKLSSSIDSYCSKVINRYNELSDEEKTKIKISAEELRFISFRYIERMTSNHLGNKQQIEELFIKSKLTIVNSASKCPVDVEGEIAKSYYYQIVAKKG